MCTSMSTFTRSVLPPPCPCEILGTINPQSLPQDLCFTPGRMRCGFTCTFLPLQEERRESKLTLRPPSLAAPYAPVQNWQHQPEKLIFESCGYEANVSGSWLVWVDGARRPWAQGAARGGGTRPPPSLGDLLLYSRGCWLLAGLWPCFGAGKFAPKAFGVSESTLTSPPPPDSTWAPC